MTNVTQPLVTPPPKGILDPRTGRPIRADDPSFGTLNNDYRDRRTDHLGAHRLADVDDVRTCLLCDRDDADVDAALRCRAFRLRPARVTSSVRRDDRGLHALQQDGRCFTQGL